VLRIRPGDPVSAADGSGRWGIGHWTPASGLVLDELHLADIRGQRPAIGVVCAVPKGDRPELVVQKLTEIGIDHLEWFDAARAVVRWDAAKRVAQLARFARIAREAAMQSRRLTVPTIGHVALEAVAARTGVALATPDGRVGWWAATDGADTDRGPAAPDAVTSNVLPRSRVSTVVVGPEGGFTDAELALVPDRVCLGGNVLRVETAAIAAGVLLAAG
jgi:16S rRNA (uracil1498-N3)-methyltransferase